MTTNTKTTSPTRPTRPVRMFDRDRFAAEWAAARERGACDPGAWMSACGIRAVSTLYDWRAGKSVPSADQLWNLERAMGLGENTLTKVVENNAIAPPRGAKKGR